MTATATMVDWVVVPGSGRDIDAIARDCQRLATRRALMAAGVAVLPVPGLDWLTDVGILVKLLPQINDAFGLTPEQIERLAPERRLAVFKAVTAGGSLLVGKLISRELVMRVLKRLGVRLTVQQASKYVPLAGQAISAALTFSALKVVCDIHIRQCAAVARELLLEAPAANGAAAQAAEGSAPAPRRPGEPG